MTQSWLSAPTSRKWITFWSWCECSRWRLGSQGRQIGRGAGAIANSMPPHGMTSRKVRFLPSASRRRRPSVIRW
eukprot:4843855-Pleurochrysis_carterae.AAC.1